jgi:hypothetical protein
LTVPPASAVLHTAANLFNSIAVKELGNEVPLYAAIEAQRPIERRDFRRCAGWKHVLDIVDEGHRRHQDTGRQDVAPRDMSPQDMSPEGMDHH